MYGLPADSVRRKRTKIVPANGLNPYYDEEPFVFKKVVLPELASLRIAAFEENGKFIGTRILPVVGLRPGYRHISLRNESLQPLTLPTLFVHITVRDYVPDGMSELADALANPIAYQSMVDKHAKQLLALADDTEDGPPLNENNLNNKVQPTSEQRVQVEDDFNRQYMRESSVTDFYTQNPQFKSEIIKAELNGGSSSKNSSKVSSPNHKSFSIRRQDTLTRKTASIKISDESSLEFKSLLESSQAQLSAEQIDQLNKAKNVQKIYAKFERDLANLTKKYDKIRDKIREAYLQDEDKAQQTFEKQKKIAMNTSKSMKKSFDG